MKILLFGSSGQIGSEIHRKFSIEYEIKIFSSKEVNFQNLNQLKKCINTVNPDLIINAAAYTDVNNAEINFEEADTINSKAVSVIAEECRKNEILLIHYSTDYVFDGKSKKPYIETDQTNPLSVYGKTKRNGEQMIKDSYCDNIILRTSWVYSSNKNNFIRKIINNSINNKELHIVDDQFGTPTSTEFISNNTLHAVKHMQVNRTSDKYFGIYHLTPNGHTNWYEYAVRFMSKVPEKEKGKNCVILPKKTEKLSSIANRPTFSVLDNRKFSAVFDNRFESWSFYLDKFINKEF